MKTIWSGRERVLSVRPERVNDVRAAIYCRISQDREGAGLGVDRQRQDCVKLCEDRGWEVIAVYEDNDLSAYSGKRRPGYETLLGTVRAHSVDVVVVWHTDRLHRSPRELEEWIVAVETAGVMTATVKAGELDLATSSGRLVARMFGAVARHESEQKGERIAGPRPAAGSRTRVAQRGTRARVEVGTVH